MRLKVAVPTGPTLRWCTPIASSGGGDSDASENSRVLALRRERRPKLLTSVRNSVLGRKSNRDARPQTSAVCFSGRSRYERRHWALYRRTSMKRSASRLLMRRVL